MLCSPYGLHSPWHPQGPWWREELLVEGRGRPGDGGGQHEDLDDEIPINFVQLGNTFVIVSHLGQALASSSTSQNLASGTGAAFLRPGMGFTSQNMASGTGVAFLEPFSGWGRPDLTLGDQIKGRRTRSEFVRSDSRLLSLIRGC